VELLGVVDGQLEPSSLQTNDGYMQKNSLQVVQGQLMMGRAFVATMLHVDCEGNTSAKMDLAK